MSNSLSTMNEPDKNSLLTDEEDALLSFAYPNLWGLLYKEIPSQHAERTRVLARIELAEILRLRKGDNK